MTERAKQIAALLRETYKQLPITGDTGFEAVAAVLVHQFDRQDARLDALEALGKAEPPLVTMHSNTGFTSQKTYPDTSPPVPQPGATRGAEVAALAAARQEVLACIWGCHYDRTNNALDKLVSVARAQALAEAEGAAKAALDFSSPVKCADYNNGIENAADAVARLRESDGAKKPPG